MKRIGLVLIWAILFVSLATPVLADDPDGDVVIWGRSYTLASGERIRGNLLVYGGDVELKAESEVAGTVTVFGGNLTIAGMVGGDVTVWGGNVDILSEATIRGRVVSLGGDVDREEGADVRGGEVEGWPMPPLPRLPTTPRTPVPPQPPSVRAYRPWGSDLWHAIGSIFRTVFGVVVLVVLGILVVTFIPRHTEIVSETMVKAPVESIGMGLVSSIGGAILLVIMSLVGALLVATICLAPVGLLLFLPYLVAGVAVVFGWIAASLLLGVKLLRALTHKEPNHVAAVALGSALLSIVSLTPCVGWLLALLVVIWGLGAVVYSLFGTRPVAGSSSGRETSQSAGDAIEDYDPRIDQL